MKKILLRDARGTVMEVESPWGQISWLVGVEIPCGGEGAMGGDQKRRATGLGGRASYLQRVSISPWAR